MLGKQCKEPRCATIHNERGGYCKQHKKESMFTNKAKDSFYDSAAWRRARLLTLRDHPICARCQERPATQVHHVISKNQQPELALDVNNLEGLCRQCHFKVSGQNKKLMQKDCNKE